MKSLYNRAVGYTYPSVKIIVVKGKVVEVPYREHVPPEPGSIMNWLKNRMPDVWRDKIDHEHGGNVNLTMSDLVSEVYRRREERKLTGAPAIEWKREETEES